MVIVLILLLFSHLLTSLGWSFIFKKFNINEAATFIPLYGSFKRFELSGKWWLIIPYTAFKVLMTISLVLAYCMYIAFVYIPADQIIAKPSVVIFMIIAYIFYLGWALCNYVANKYIVERLWKSKEDAVWMSFFPPIFVPVFVYQTMQNNATSKTKSNFNARLKR